MQITSSFNPNDLPLPPEGNAVSAISSSGADRAGDTGNLTNFANLAELMVFGNPSEHAIGQVESHFRALHAQPKSGEALRQLRQQSEQQGIYPILVFEDTPSDKPITLLRDRTARPGEPVDLKAAPNAQPSGRPGKENEIMGLIGRVADDLSWLQREHEPFVPALSAPLQPSMSATMAHLEALRKLPSATERRLEATAMNLARMAGMSRAEIEAHANQAAEAPAQRP